MVENPSVYKAIYGCTLGDFWKCARQKTVQPLLNRFRNTYIKFTVSEGNLKVLQTVLHSV